MSESHTVLYSVNGTGKLYDADGDTDEQRGVSDIIGYAQVQLTVDEDNPGQTLELLIETDYEYLAANIHSTVVEWVYADEAESENYWHRADEFQLKNITWKVLEQ